MKRERKYNVNFYIKNGPNNSNEIKHLKYDLYTRVVTFNLEVDVKRYRFNFLGLSRFSVS